MMDYGEMADKIEQTDVGVSSEEYLEAGRFDTTTISNASPLGS